MKNDIVLFKWLQWRFILFLFCPLPINASKNNLCQVSSEALSHYPVDQRGQNLERFSFSDFESLGAQAGVVRTLSTIRTLSGLKHLFVQPHCHSLHMIKSLENSHTLKARTKTLELVDGPQDVLSWRYSTMHSEISAQKIAPST